MTDNLDLMTELSPRSTGLPMVVWASPSYGAEHDVQIMVAQHHGEQINPGELAIVALLPELSLVAGELSATDLQLVAEWFELNRDALVDYWSMAIDGAELGQHLRKPSP